MQDEVRDKSVALAIKVGKTGGRLTADLLKWAIRKYLAQSQNPKIHHGKQSVKQLVGQGTGVKSITVTDGIYYYHGERVRIFMDLRMNGSFENFIFDNEGSIDLRVLRDKNNSITNVEYLTESEADELLYDMDEYSPDNQLEVPLEKEDSLDNSDVPLKDQNIGRSVRVTKEELSEELRDIISSCDTETWYVIKSAGYQYIYFGGLPYNYTFQPEIYTDRNSGTVNVFDMGTTTGNYVLLEIQQNVSLTINYNGTQISYTEL